MVIKMNGMPEFFSEWAKNYVPESEKENVEKAAVSLRPDIPRESFSKNELMKGAAHTENGFFTVKKVIGKEDE